MLALHTISLALKEGPVLLKPMTLRIAPGETVTLMGPSGAGKSALLSFIGGDLPTAFVASGDVRLKGHSVLALPPEKRRIGRLFQDDFLFPHMTVGENLLFALPRMAHRARLEKMLAALAQVELEGFAGRPPQTLSGGQRARVALMRVLLSEPAAILLDEPFSKLDASLRAAMRALTFRMIRERKIPALLVTHDRDDAPEGGRVLVIRNGEVSDA
ncbi:MAG: ATP-binding cassette domain-containing protein [Hyphomicrobiales bacterium]